MTATEPPSTVEHPGAVGIRFLANVNPHHDHPRWSQATEQRIGEAGGEHVMFHGYAARSRVSTRAWLDVHSDRSS